MKDVRFYLEFGTAKAKHKSGKSNNGHSGNVFALFLNDGYRAHPEGLGAVLFVDNSPVASTGASWDYINGKCKRISEALARRIHPALFERLDSE